METKKSCYHSIFWLWIPLIFLAAHMTMEALLPRDTMSAMQSEGGLHEIIQFILMAIGFFVALFTLRFIDWKTEKWLGAWVVVAMLSCFYVAGEEVSWGQWFLNWSTPEYWSAINDQNETNFHNTTSWLDQKPRTILLIGVIVGGLIIPLLRKFKPSALPAKFEIIYPLNVMAVTAGLLLFVFLFDKIDDQLPSQSFFTRASEVEEIYLDYFVMLYLVILCGRLLQRKA